MLPAFARLNRDRLRARLVLVGADPALRAPWIEHRPWSLDSERDDLASFDLGIMPLPDSEWARGKCGYKALQYFSAGVPAIASPVGVARELVGEDGERGALASSPEEWHAALERLAADAAERARMGRRGARARRARLLLPALGSAARGAAPLGRMTALWVPWLSATVTGVAPGEKRAASVPRARDLVRRRARFGCCGCGAACAASPPGPARRRSSSSATRSRAPRRSRRCSPS